jgi:HlyD family secretion protein
LQSQAQAASTLLDELNAQPRKETLDVAESQVVAAQAGLKTAQDALDKQQAAYDLDPKSVSKDALDTAANAVATANANLEVARKQRDLTKAGAWVYDVNNQERTYNALYKSYLSASALLAKYTLIAPKDGIVLAINPTVGSYVSAQGAYDTYTQGMDPVLVLGSPHAHLNVRCYVDEILVPRLPGPAAMKAQMSVRGSTVKIPLEYLRMQPFVSPKIELSDQKLERVDVRVLPVIFRIETPKDLNLYPGLLVDVYIGE